LLGFARRHRIGVDVEQVRDNMDVEGLAKRFFSANEFQVLHSLRAGQRTDAFFRGWTRKEAYLKARGEALSYGLDRVEVSLGPDEPPAILSADDDPDVSQHWIVQQLLPAPGFIGAVAVEPAL